MGIAFKGVMQVPATIFKEDFSLDLPAFERMVDFCVRTGASTITWPNHKSESLSLTWLGLVAPAGTPGDIVNKLHVNIVKTLQDADISRRFIADGAVVTPSRSPEAFGALIRSEITKWAKVVKDSGIQPE